MISKPATTSQPIHPLLRDRWSPRAFSTEPLTSEQIVSLFEAARWSPSGGNSQPWSFITVAHNDAIFPAFLEALNEGNRVWAQHAPLLVVAVARTVRDGSGGKVPNGHALYDLGQSVAHLSIQAASLGLYVHQMAGFSADRTREVFNIPEDYAAVTVFTIGHIGDPEALPEQLRGREEAPRTRKPLTEFVFAEAWGQTAEAVK